MSDEDQQTEVPAQTLLVHAESHLDHGLTEAQRAHVLDMFAMCTEAFSARVELPARLGTVPCALIGPATGGDPVDESAVSYARRGSRPWESRVIACEPAQTRIVTIIAGPHDGHPCVVYTMYGGPQAPQEPGDPGCKDPDASRVFWREHALAIGAV